MRGEGLSTIEAAMESEPTRPGLERTNSLSDSKRQEIQHWQRKSSIEQPIPEGKGIINWLYGTLAQVLERILQHLGDNETRLSKSSYRRLESVFSSLQVWAVDHGVEEGRLDSLLEKAKKLRKCTIKTMADICETLIKELLPLLDRETESSLQTIISQTLVVDGALKEACSRDRIKPDYGDLSSDGSYESRDPSRETSPGDSLDEVVENLSEDVECLLDLSPMLLEPEHDMDDNELVHDMPDDNEPAAAASENNSWDLEKTFCEGIRAKFPQCDDNLVQDLGRATRQTCQRLQAERETTHELASNAGLVPVPVQQAAKTVLNDSGVGTSLPATNLQPPQGLHVPGSSYAQTVMSIRNADGTTRSRIPRQPQDRQVGQPFPCMACGQQISKSSSERAWKRHLMTDLRPWICCQVLCRCERNPFLTKEQWVEHLRAQHNLFPDWDDKTCPFCKDVIPQGGALMIDHVESHLQEISLAALPASTDDDDDDEEEMKSEHSEAEVRPNMPPPPPLPPSKPIQLESIEDHPVYKRATQQADGLWHCPWQGEDYCGHEPTMMKSDLLKYVESHLEDSRCKVAGCERSGRSFATKESLRLHEQEAHDMHKEGTRPYLCSSPGCGRSIPGNGFMDHWVRNNHIKEVHGNLDLPPLHDDDEGHGSGFLTINIEEFD